VRIAVLSAVRLYGEGLAECLGTRGDISIVGSAHSLAEIETLLQQAPADVTLFDTSVNGTLEEVRQLVCRFPETRVIAVALSETEQEIIAWAEAGVAAYVPREATLGELYTAIFAAMRGEVSCSPRIAGTLLRELRRRPEKSYVAGERLTSRESETLRLIAHGMSNKEIAQALSISVSTVKNHVHSILEKLRVRTRAQAAAQMSGHRARFAAS
jgi:DNA-binding NarL/FixJ family response regulator